jgi:signal transduction histidine kinase
MTRCRRKFINFAAHELPIAIQPVLSLVDAFRSDVTTTEVQAILPIVIRIAGRLNRLAEDILNVTRIESQLFVL